MFNGKNTLFVITGAEIFWGIVILLGLIVWGVCGFMDWNTRRKRISKNRK